VGAAVAAAVLVVVGLSVGRRPVELRVAPRQVEVAAQKPAAVAPKVEVAKAVFRAKPRRGAPPRRPELAKEPMKIQMLTDDPDVVIIWLVGEEQEGALE
jgi:hypothetical protein